MPTMMLPIQFWEAFFPVIMLATQPASAPKISQDVLAARVGTTRSRVNYFMNKFKKLGLIEYNGAIKAHTGLINIIVHD